VFQEQVFQLKPGSRAKVEASARLRDIFPGVWIHDHFPRLPEDSLLVCVDELHTRADLESLVLLLEEAQ
jgi:hypothetical protein